jgi:signal peptidase I
MKLNKIQNFLKYLDPFTYLDLVLEKVLGNSKDFKSKIIYWVAYILFSFLLAYLFYLLLSIILGVSMPLAIVVSSSMEPNLHRGDLVILTKAKNLNIEVIELDYNISNLDLKDFLKLNFKTNEYGLKEIDSLELDNNKIIYIEDTKNNDIIVYKSNVKPIDIIHRAIVYFKAKDGDFVLTKGDNNKTNRLIDQDCNINSNTGLTENLCLNIYPTSINSVKGKLIGKIPYIGYIKLGFFK